MKNKLFFAIAFVLVQAGASAQAQLKVGYTNVDYVLSQLPDSKQIESELKTYRTQLESQLLYVAQEWLTLASLREQLIADAQLRGPTIRL